MASQPEPHVDERPEGLREWRETAGAWRARGSHGPGERQTRDRAAPLGASATADDLPRRSASE